MFGLKSSARHSEFLALATTKGDGIWFRRGKEISLRDLASDYARRVCSLAQYWEKVGLYFLTTDDLEARRREFDTLLDSKGPGWWIWKHFNSSSQQQIYSRFEKDWAGLIFAKSIVSSGVGPRPITLTEFVRSHSMEFHSEKDIVHTPFWEPSDERRQTLPNGGRATIHFRRRGQNQSPSILFVIIDNVNGIEWQRVGSILDGRIRLSGSFTPEGGGIRFWTGTPDARDATAIVEYLGKNGVTEIADAMTPNPERKGSLVLNLAKQVRGFWRK